MKQYPKNFNYGRIFRVKLKKNHLSKYFLNIWFHEYGLKALDSGKIRVQHINAISRLLKRNFKKELKTRFNISLNTPVTKKPDEARMGKGKGQRFCWEYNAKKGSILLEVGGFVDKDKLFKALKYLQEKLPLYTKIIRVIY